uniref:Uncharacterized protein n=1 Tax=Setaria digitata TaxID=48799 RepID=A0A915PKW6_9BILA
MIIDNFKEIDYNNAKEEEEMCRKCRKEVHIASRLDVLDKIIIFMAAVIEPFIRLFRPSTPKAISKICFASKAAKEEKKSLEITTW